MVEKAETSSSSSSSSDSEDRASLESVEVNGSNGQPSKIVRVYRSVTKTGSVSNHALENLQYYRYNSVDKSPLSKYVLQPYWNFCVKLFPMWMAPNLITLIGFSFIIFNFVLMCITMPDLEPKEGLGYRLVYLTYGVGLWAYSTFDNVDGKQARRTGTSSPLGELFDHGCDAINSSIGCLVEAAGLGLGYSWNTVKLMYFTVFAFYMATWDEYHTGKLYLGYVNGPTEGLLLASLTPIISAIWGVQVWQTPTHRVLEIIRADLLLRDTWVWNYVAQDAIADTSLTLIILLLYTTQVPQSIWFVYRKHHNNPIRLLKCLMQPLPLFVLFASVYAWLEYSEIVMHSYYFIVFLSAAGMVFGRMVSKIILAHVTHSSFPYFSTATLIPLAVGSTAVYFNLLGGQMEKMYIWAFLVFATYNYMHWAIIVIDRFCEYLDINCLTIKNKDGATKINGPRPKGAKRTRSKRMTRSQIQVAKKDNKEEVDVETIAVKDVGDDIRQRIAAITPTSPS